MSNTWNGTLTKDMFDLSNLETSYETFTNLTKKYLTNCLIGNAHLTGEGTLTEHFDDLLEEVIERGEIALIEVAKNKYLAIPKKLNESLLKEKVPGEKENEPIEPVLSYEFTLLDNSNLTYQNKDLTKWTIFKFNKQGTKPLAGLSFWTNRLTNILTKMEKEMFMNEKRLMFFSSESADERDVAKWIKSFTNGIITIFAFDKSANPDKNALAEGKQGINPQAVKFEVYEPKEFQEEKHRKQFAFVWTNMERAYGIKAWIEANKEAEGKFLELQKKTGEELVRLAQEAQGFVRNEADELELFEPEEVPQPDLGRLKELRKGAIALQKNNWEQLERTNNESIQSEEIGGIIAEWKEIKEELREPAFILWHENNVLTFMWWNEKGVDLGLEKYGFLYRNKLYWVERFVYVDNSKLYVRIEAKVDLIYLYYGNYLRGSGTIKLKRAPLFQEDLENPLAKSNKLHYPFCDDKGNLAMKEVKNPDIHHDLKQ